MTENTRDPKNAGALRNDVNRGGDAYPASEEDPAAVLERVLLVIYDEMLPHLEIELGSRDAALEALQDTSEKLAGRPAIGAVHNPAGYLRRMALNLGRNRRRAAGRYSPATQAWLDELPDTAPGPERAAAGRRDIAVIMAALEDLPVNRRAIFLDKFRDELSLDEIARLRGIHRRTVQKELQRVTRFLRARLGWST